MVQVTLLFQSTVSTQAETLALEMKLEINHFDVCTLRGLFRNVLLVWIGHLHIQHLLLNATA